MIDNYNIPTFESEHPEAAAILVQQYQAIAPAVSPLTNGQVDRWKARRPQTYQEIIPQERNERCECGSGRKAKKCCNIVPKCQNPGDWSMRVTMRDGQPVDELLTAADVHRNRTKRVTVPSTHQENILAGPRPRTPGSGLSMVLLGASLALAGASAPTRWPLGSAGTRR